HGGSARRPADARALLPGQEPRPRGGRAPHPRRALRPRGHLPGRRARVPALPPGPPRRSADRERPRAPSGHARRATALSRGRHPPRRRRSRGGTEAAGAGSPAQSRLRLDGGRRGACAAPGRDGRGLPVNAAPAGPPKPLRRAALVAAFVLAAASARAHTVGVSRGEYRVSRSALTATLTVARAELRTALPVLDADGDGSLSEEELTRGREVLAAFVLRGLDVRSSTGACAGSVEDARL